MRDTDTMLELTSDEIEQVSGGITPGEGVETANSGNGKVSIGLHPFPGVNGQGPNPAGAGTITAASVH